MARYFCSTPMKSQISLLTCVMSRIAFCSSRILASSKKPKLLKSVHGGGYVLTATVSRQGAPKN